MERQDLKQFMAMPLDLVEPPNTRRGGWSNVATLANGDQTFFLKRQENHCYRDVKHLFFPVPTLRREYDNLRLLARIGIPVPKTVLYVEEHGRALMLSHKAPGVDLNTYLGNEPDQEERDKVIQQLANVLFLMHSHHRVHGCLYPKHVLVSPGSVQSIVLIDLEKSKYVMGCQRAAAQDLSRLFFYTTQLRQRDRQAIVSVYRHHWRGFESILTARIAKDLRRRDVRRHCDGLVPL